MEPIENNHDNLEDIAQMKENKSEIEDKVARILKLLKSNGQDKKGKMPDDSRKKTEIIGLIQELQTEYNKLYAQYDHLRGEIGKKSRKRLDKENASSIQSSDSEYYSSDELENKDDPNSNDKESDPELDRFQESDFQTPREFQTPRGLKTPRKEHKSKRSDRNREPSSMLVKVPEGSEVSGQIKELEGQLTVVRMDLESVRKERDELQVRVGEKETEVKQLNEANSQLSSRVSELQVMVGEKETEVEQLNESNSQISSRVSELQVMVGEKETEVTQLNEANSQINSRVSELQAIVGEKETEVKQLNDANLQSSSRVFELQAMVEEKGNEVSDLTTKIAENQKEFDSRIETLTTQANKGNKESAVVKALKDEAKRMQEEMAKRADMGRGWLKEKEGVLVQLEELKLEVNSLHDQKHELEETLRGKEQESDNLCQENEKLKTKVQELESKTEEQENEASTRILALKEQVNNLQQEIDSTQRERRKWKTNSAQNLTELDSDESNKILKEKEDLKLFKTHSLDIQKLRVAESPRTFSRLLNQHTLERKIAELAEKFQMKVENQMRLLTQRIRVAEQIQTENRESYKKIVEDLECENKELNGKNAAFESEAKKVREMLEESGNYMLPELDLMVKKIDEEHGKFLNRISKISDELDCAREWITGKNGEVKNLKENLEIFTCKDGEFGENSPMKLMELKTEDLEKKLREKDEEKREVIRQLCVQIDYHRHRYDDLKETVSKMPIKFKKLEKK